MQKDPVWKCGCSTRRLHTRAGCFERVHSSLPVGTGGHESIYLLVHPNDGSNLRSYLRVANNGTLGWSSLHVLRNVDHLVNLQVGGRASNQCLRPGPTVDG